MVLLSPCDIGEALTFGHLPQPRFLIIEPFKAQSVGSGVPQRMLT